MFELLVCSLVVLKVVQLNALKQIIGIHWLCFVLIAVLNQRCDVNLGQEDLEDALGKVRVLIFAVHLTSKIKKFG